MTVRQIDRAIYALVLVALVAAAFVAGWAWSDDDGAYCPTEDSCAVDYREGAWHIAEVTP